MLAKNSWQFSGEDEVFNQVIKKRQLDSLPAL